MNYSKRLVLGSCLGKYDHIFKGEIISFQLKFIPFVLQTRHNLCFKKKMLESKTNLKTD